MNEQEKRDYELVYVVQPEIEEAELTNLNERIVQSIQNQDGEIVDTEAWGRRKLAYPIENHYEGHYYVQRMQIPPQGVGVVEQGLRFSEDVIRFLTMSVDA